MKPPADALPLLSAPSALQPLEVVFVSNNLVRGGAETQLVRIASTLRQRGWRVGILILLPLNAFEQELQEAGIPVVACGRHTTPPHLFASLRMGFQMIRQLRRWRPPLLISFNFHADILGRFCGRLGGVPHIIASLRTAHAKTPWREALYRVTEPMVDLTASNSHAAVTFMVNRRVLTYRKTAVIPNGMITSQFPDQVSREEMRAELGVAPETFLWLAVGALRPAKDYPTLLEAAARCVRAVPGFRLLIAGDGELLPDFEAQIAALGLERTVQFLGLRLDVPRLLRACDAYVLSSAWEGLPNTVMEAMASAVPVLATNVGGVPELIEPCVSGFSLPPGDPALLAQRMLDMMALPPAALANMGAKARATIVERYDNERVVDQWERQIREVCPPFQRQTCKAPPAFIISLDFELMWGMRDRRTIAGYGANILGERQAVPALLRMLTQYQVKATWAAVGLTLFDNRKELMEYLPDLKPTYEQRNLNPFPALDTIGDSERSDPYHYGLSLIRQVLDCPGMELGSHTFSHYYCLEKGQKLEQFKSDLAASVAATRRLTDAPVSFVFPRNQYHYPYLSACADNGFKVFRGNEKGWIYRESMEADRSLPRRGVRLLDNYFNLSGPNDFVPRLQGKLLNCPSSRFLRPYSDSFSWLERLRLHRIRAAMESAARSGNSFHLWWHPHNFGANLEQNLAALEDLLRFHVELRERYGVVPMTMGETATYTSGLDGVR